MAITVREVAELVRGVVVGDGSRLIRAARPMLQAQVGDITFIEDEKYLARFRASGAAAAIVNTSIAVNGDTMVRVDDPRAAFTAIHEKLHPRPKPAFAGVHPTANIHPSADIGLDAWIGPGVSIGENCTIGSRCKLHPGCVVGDSCRLGDDVVLYPNVVIYDSCVMGNRVIVHANAVIGADGFGYRLSPAGHAKVPQIGYVEIGDDVEIGACTTIDRASFGATTIGAGTKIDNLVQVGHNCQIGQHNIFCSQVGIAGSVTTGDFVLMAGQAGVCDHLDLGDRVQIGVQACITRDVPPDKQMWGTPAIVAKEHMRSIVMLEKLPEIRKEMRKIKQQLDLSEKPKE